MAFLTLKTEQLVEADWNYKRDMDDPDVVTVQEKLKTNLKRNGQLENIIVRELPTGYYEVVNGNHRLLAFRALGVGDVHVFNLGPISDAKAQRIAVETNETKFEADPLKLGSLLKSLTEEYKLEDLSDSMPFSVDELNNFMKMSDFDWNKDPKFDPDDTSKQGDADDFEAVTLNVPKQVASQFWAEMERLKKAIGEISGKPVVDFIRPFECMVLLCSQLTDVDLKAELAGG